MCWLYKKPSMRALLPKGTFIVRKSSTITTPALGSVLKATMGCGDIISGRTLNRLRQVTLNGGSKQESETYRRLTDYLEQLKATSEGITTDCQLNCIQVGVRLLVFNVV